MNWSKIIWHSVGVLIVLAMMVGAVMWGFHMRPMDRPCAAIEFVIEDREDRLYLSERELDQVLRNADLHPVGKTLNPGVLHRIEQTIRRHPMVRTAESYVTPRAVVRIIITQRIPLLKVVKTDELFYIEPDRQYMPSRETIKDKVLIAKGAVGRQMATGQLSDFALWMQDQPYWQKRTNYVWVQSPQMTYIYLRPEAAQEAHAPRLVLGPMKEYERKLGKMQTFLDHSAEPIQNKQYTEYDLRFRGQVIGRNE